MEHHKKNRNCEYAAPVQLRLEDENPSPQDPILILYHYISFHLPSGLFPMEL